MASVKQEYISIKKLAFKYDIHPDTIRKKELIEGLHFIRIGKLIRYDTNEMHKLLTESTTKQTINLDNFFINTIQ